MSILLHQSSTLYFYPIYIQVKWPCKKQPPLPPASLSYYFRAIHSSLYLYSYTCVIFFILLNHKHIYFRKFLVWIITYIFFIISLLFSKTSIFWIYRSPARVGNLVLNHCFLIFEFVFINFTKKYFLFLRILSILKEFMKNFLKSVEEEEIKSLNPNTTPFVKSVICWKKIRNMFALPIGTLEK